MASWLQAGDCRLRSLDKTRSRHRSDGGTRCNLPWLLKGVHQIARMVGRSLLAAVVLEVLVDAVKLKSVADHTIAQWFAVERIDRQIAEIRKRRRVVTSCDLNLHELDRGTRQSTIRLLVANGGSCLVKHRKEHAVISV